MIGSRGSAAVTTSWVKWGDVFLGSAVAALITIGYSLSYAALLFGAAPPEAQARGLFMMMMSVGVLGCVGAALTKWPFVFVTVEGTPIVVLAGGTTAIAVSLTGAEPGVIGATIVVGTIITSFLTGLAMTLLGQWKAAGVARFVPLQVIAGVSAASGLSLLLGGGGVALGHMVSVAGFRSPVDWVHLGPAVFFALAMLFTTRWIAKPATLPVLIAGGIPLHHAVFASLGITIAEQQRDGWLLLAPAQIEPVLPWSHASLDQVDWAILASHLPTAAAVVTVTCLSTLVTLSAVELATRRDADVDRDLRAVGTASIVAALCGGLFGSVSQGRSLLLFGRSGGAAAGTVLCAIIAGSIPLLFPGLINYVPRWVLGALLINIGFGMLDTWLVRIRSRLTLLEWLTVPVVVLVTFYFGLPAAVFTGLALGCVTFAAIYSLGNPVRARYRGDVAHSNVARTEGERAYLLAHPHALLVIYLQGFLFFGTANRLLQDVRQEIANPNDAPTNRLRHIVLDCSNIDGIDGSAAATFERLLQITTEQGVSLTLASLSQQARLRLQSGIKSSEALQFTASLDQALEQYENELLVDYDAGTPFALPPLEPDEFDSEADYVIFRDALETRIAAPGQVLMAQFETSDDLVFIEQGRANIMLATQGGRLVRTRQVGPGTMVGEIGFLLGTPRTATVKADTECSLMVLTRAAMGRLQVEHPAVAFAVQRAMVRKLALRLIDKDHIIETLLRGSTKSA